MPSYRTASVYERPPLHRRASGLALALAINVLVILALIGVGYRPVAVIKPSGTLVIDLLSNAPPPASAPAPRQAREERAEPKPVRTLSPPVIILPVKPEIAPEPKLEMIELSREDYLTGDIGKMAKAKEPGTAGRAGDSRLAGVGPNGQALYNAEWVREPSGAELNGYLPAKWSDGWGEVACRTIPGHRVEDCVEIASHPRGSRFASAVRQAAWQFRVRPPRKNGRELVGEWVQIRIDYVRVAAR
ncbi:hypothetical protein BH24PSE1_BH24PSE1_03800 [soil metagenome]